MKTLLTVKFFKLKLQVSGSVQKAVFHNCTPKDIALSSLLQCVLQIWFFNPMQFFFHTLLLGLDRNKDARLEQIQAYRMSSALEA